VSKKIGIDARKLLDFGIGTYIRNLIYQISELDDGNRYVLLVSPEGREVLSDLPERFKLVTYRSPVYSIREQVTLSWVLWRLRLDLYHSTHYVLPLWVPCPAVVTIHDIIHLLYPEFLRHRLAFFYAFRMLRRGLARGRRIITVSRTTLADLRRFFQVPEDKVQVIYNGVESIYHKRLGRDDIKGRLEHLGITPPYLLFVGNPKPHKNLDNVVQAYARAREIHDVEACLVCVGGRDGAEQKVLRRAEQMGIADQVQILGHVEQNDLSALYQGAELFLYPTLYEGFGLPVVEAMASGTAVITSNTSALKEIAEGYAHLVNPLDVPAITEAIGHCLANPDHRRALVELGRKRAREFSWRKAAERTLKVYSQVLYPGQKQNKEESHH
jgi:glycosyltransferase involved in cell wall biosynthesis